MCLLEDGPNLTVPEMLECMDHAFGHVHKYDAMIRSLHEIRQKEGESLEKLHVTNQQGCGGDLPCLPGPGH